MVDKKMAEKKLENPTVLAFEAKLVPSDALMFSGNWGEDDWQAIAVTEKSVRGTISNRLKAAISNDPAKLDAEVSKPNIQSVDTAALPHGCDTLKVSFSLRILGGLAEPSSCNNPEYQTALSALIESYTSTNGLKELALRYAQNIANARFLWRNRVGAEDLRVDVELDGEKLEFKSYDFALRDFSNDGAVQKLSAVIERGLAGQGYALLNISAYSRLGAGQPVYPSQELVMGGSKGDKSKHLYQLSGQAAMHSQKIGNALRTIDTWHKAVEEVGPIAIEPYGAVTSRGAAYRQPKEKTDFYSLLDGWLLKGKEPELDQQHYIIAMLIRGGVFGG